RSFDAAAPHPKGLIVQGSDGAFYGTTEDGTVFKISADGTQFSVLHDFNSYYPPGNDGRYPYAGVVEGSDHAFYGTTLLGGESDCGTVFRVTADGSSYTILRSFDCVGPRYPIAGLVEGPDGALYGTTYSGGTSDDGTVFRISKDGLAFDILHAFDG